jgi:methionyl-tRNA formyltransferase
LTGTERIVVATPFARFDRLVETLRRRHGYDVLHLRMREELTPYALRAFGPSHVFFPHWSWKIPSAVHDAFECVIFHMTDVPFGRGGSPLQNLVVRGIENTQLTALRCAEIMDAGPVYMKLPLSTLGSVEEVMLRAAALMEPMILKIVGERVKPQPQEGEPVVFHRRVPRDGDLSVAETLEVVHNLIRMLDGDGYPPAFIEVGRLRLEFTRASRKVDHVVADVRISFAPEGSAE